VHSLIFLQLHSILKCTLTEEGERHAYKDKYSRTKQCTFNRFECTLTKIYVHSQQSLNLQSLMATNKDVCTITTLQFTELNVHLQRWMYT